MKFGFGWQKIFRQFKDAIQKYKYWKKLDRNTWLHIPSGDKLEIIREEGFRFYYITHWIANTTTGDYIDVDGASTRADAIYVVEEHLSENDVEEFDFYKFYKAQQWSPATEEDWKKIKKSPSYDGSFG